MTLSAVQMCVVCILSMFAILAGAVAIRRYQHSLFTWLWVGVIVSAVYNIIIYGGWLMHAHRNNNVFAIGQINTLLLIVLMIAVRLMTVRRGE